jgi:2'-5' RNA ligase
MNVKIFLVVSPKDEYINTILDAIRIFADPVQKHGSHITLRGPYERDFDNLDEVKFLEKKIEEIEKKIIGTKVIVEGINHFFNHGQNTVYFNCIKDEKLLEVMYKKNYRKEKNPHITIYDGKDVDFSKQLFNRLYNKKIYFEFDIEKVDTLVSIYKSQGRMFLLKDTLNFSILSEILSLDITYELILKMQQTERLDYIEKLANLLIDNSYYVRKDNFLIKKEEITNAVSQYPFRF